MTPTEAQPQPEPVRDALDTVLELAHIPAHLRDRVHLPSAIVAAGMRWYADPEEDVLVKALEVLVGVPNYPDLSRSDVVAAIVSRAPAAGQPSTLTGEELYERWNRLLIDSGAEPRPWSRMASEDPRESCLWDDLAAGLTQPPTEEERVTPREARTLLRCVTAGTEEDIVPMESVAAKLRVIAGES